MRSLGVALLATLFAATAAADRDPHAGPAMNFQRIDAELATGGHFVGDGLKKLAGEGVEVVIDLRPENPRKRRAAVTGQGIEYVHVPVSWRAPTLEQFEHFREAMDKAGGRHVLVQCAANYRASAMTYLYRTLIQDVADDEARADMETVWSPNERWQEYMAEVRNAAAR